MSEEQNQQTAQISNEDKERIQNAFFAKSVKLLPLGVLIHSVNLKEEEIDVAISNEDIADIYNAINGESPFDAESDEKGTELSKDNEKSNEL